MRYLVFPPMKESRQGHCRESLTSKTEFGAQGPNMDYI